MDCDNMPWIEHCEYLIHPTFRRTLKYNCKAKLCMIFYPAIYKLKIILTIDLQEFMISLIFLVCSIYECKKICLKVESPYCKPLLRTNVFCFCRSIWPCLRNQAVLNQVRISVISLRLLNSTWVVRCTSLAILLWLVFLVPSSGKCSMKRILAP